MSLVIRYWLAIANLIRSALSVLGWFDSKKGKEKGTGGKNVG